MQPDLPIHRLADDMRAAWRTNNRLVLVAPTGSGKTTQVCQLLLADGVVPRDKLIVVLQPRRVAARTVARRVASELGCELGQDVGYKVRFEEALSSRTRIAFVTEGMLLRWLQADPNLAHVGALLFDEFHERNQLSDLALALCKRLQTARPELLLMVMSATLDAAITAAYLGGCPLLQSDGRAFPVDVRYADWDDDSPIWERAALKVGEVLKATRDGDVLVFVPGAFEIEQTMREVRRLGITSADGRTTLLLPLHGELSSREQDRAFETNDAVRRVIVATNVAETSLTLPNIRYVVDGGSARIARYDPARGINELRLEPISQASADQRAGRAGRVAAGVCHRLWSARNHAARAVRNVPEVQRADLAEAVLLLHAHGVRNAAHFDWLDAPSAERVGEADALLRLLGAVAQIEPGGFEATETGRAMLELPVHPRHARMLIEGMRLGCARDVALFVALTGGRDLLARIARNDRVTLRNRAMLNTDPRTDFVLLKNAFERAKGCGFDARTSYASGINPHVAREVERTWQQLCGLIANGTANAGADSIDLIARCHLAGNLDHLAVRISSGSDEFDLADGRRAELRDDSALRSQRAKSTLVVASEIREIATRSGASLTLLGACSVVKPGWLIELQPPGFAVRVEHVYDRLNKRVVAGRVLRLDGLAVGGEPVRDLDPAECGRVLANEFAFLLANDNHAPQFPNFTAALRKQVLDLHLTDAQVAAIVSRAWHGCVSVKEAALREINIDSLPPPWLSH